MASDEEMGARPKDRSQRMRPPVDYRRLHEGTGYDDLTPGKSTLGKKTTSGFPEGSSEKDVFSAVAAAGLDLVHGNADKVLNDLAREIEVLESSLREVNSQLKAASLRK